MRAIWALVIFGACGPQQAAVPVQNTASPITVGEEKPTCLSAIESWYFDAGIQPASADGASAAQFEAALAAMRANQHALVEVCQQDRWSREVRRCFTSTHSMALAVEAHEPAECKRMLDGTQLANLQTRIRQLGESALD